MKTIRHTGTLFYYDGPQVFEARDAIGGHYVAVMVEPENGRDRYLVVGVAPERLRRFRSGALDLRLLLTDRPDTDWYTTTAEAGLDGPLPLATQDTSLLESGLLPDAGFFLQNQLATNGDPHQAHAPILGPEAVELTGALEEADLVSGAWRLSAIEGTFSGKIKPGGPSLEGLKLGGSYHFSCLEEIEEAEGTGRGQRTLYLIEREPV